jgi:hypothetical protein
MTHADLMDLEIFLDITGFCCCVLSILYLFRLKRKFELKHTASGEIRQALNATFTSAPMDLPPEMPFENVLESAKKDSPLNVPTGKNPSRDPYNEVRRLLDLGMGAGQIAERMKIPQCEIELIDSLRQIQAGSDADPSMEKKFAMN